MALRIDKCKPSESAYQKKKNTEKLIEQWRRGRKEKKRGKTLEAHWPKNKMAIVPSKKKRGKLKPSLKETSKTE
jgi:hypothetical protein